METCPQCGNEYQAIGKHWSRSSTCSFPLLTPHQREVVTGMLMGDGCINRHGNRNPFLQCMMVTRPYLEYVDSVFGILGTGVRFEKTAADSAKQSRESGFSPYAKAENYSDVYYWKSRSLPALQPFAEWYSSGSKVFPEDIDLTPTVLKHWFCGDGNFNNSSRNHSIRIATSNEREHKEKIERCFEKGPGVEVCNWYEHQRKTGGWTCKASFTRAASEELWEYMGDPLPGFEYKWPDGFK